MGPDHERVRRPHAPARYELRVQGHLDQHWSAWFGGLAITHEDDGTTTLRGLVTDQAALHGLLAKVRDLGVTLISVRPLTRIPVTLVADTIEVITPGVGDHSPTASQWAVMPLPPTRPARGPISHCRDRDGTRRSAAPR